MNVLETQVSIYENIRDTEGTRRATVGSLLKTIQLGGKNGDIAKRIQQIRSESDKEKRSLMKKMLPVVMWQGVFSKRGKSGLESLSGIMCIDIDHKSESELLRLRESLIRFPWVLAIFRSPSGDGWKILIKTAVQTTNDYENCYAQLIDSFMQKLQCEVDESCMEYSKACYLSYDPDLYINHDVQDYPYSYNPSFDKQNSPVQKQSTGSGSSSFQINQPTSQEVFVNNLNMQFQNLSDEDIIQILDRRFHRYSRNYEIGYRRDSIYNQAIIMCKAGISEIKTVVYLESQYRPLGVLIDELEFEIKKAYMKFQQLYGTERGQYQNYDNYRQRHSKAE